MHTPTLVQYFAAMAACCLLAACGGGDVGEADTTSAAARAPQAPQVTQAPQAAQTPTADQLMDWAEGVYPQFFPEHQANRVLPPYLYRAYSTDNYLGIDGNNIYILGPVAGGGPAPVLVGTLTGFACNVFPASCVVTPAPTPTGPSASRGATLWTRSLGSQGYACMDCHGSTPNANFSQIWNASGTRASQGDPATITRAIQSNQGGLMFQFDVVSATDLADLAAYVNAMRYGKSF